MVERIEREIDTVDVLINNAGYGHFGAVEEASMADIRRQMEVNFFGILSMIKAVPPGMRRRRRGRIINVTSIGGITTFLVLASITRADSHWRDRRRRCARR